MNPRSAQLLLCPPRLEPEWNQPEGLGDSASFKPSRYVLVLEGATPDFARFLFRSWRLPDRQVEPMTPRSGADQNWAGVE